MRHALYGSVNVIFFALMVMCAKSPLDQGPDSFDIEVLRPRGGETFVTGRSVPIVWTAKGRTVDSVQIFASIDGGLAWKCISGPTPLFASSDTGSFGWAIGDAAFPVDLIVGKPCKIRIANLAATVEGVSGIFFAAAIKLVAPNGGERYRVDSTISILVELDSSVIRDLVFQISFDNGVIWLPLTDGSLLVSERTFEYGWTIASEMYDNFGTVVSTLSDSCLIRAGDYDETYVDQSDRVFAIYQ